MRQIAFFANFISENPYYGVFGGENPYFMNQKFFYTFSSEKSPNKNCSTAFNCVGVT